MGIIDWFLGGTSNPVQTSASPTRNRRGLTVNERRQSRQRQLADLNERIALEEARAKVRAIKARGRPKQTVTTSPIASVRETLEEALDLADSLRGGRRDYDPTPGPAPDAPGWERLLNSPAGLKIAETLAPALAPMLAGLLTPPAVPVVERTASAIAAPMDGPEPVATEQEERIAMNLIASVVQFVHLAPDQAARALISAARSEAGNGKPELLEIVTNAARMPAMIVKAIANRYRADPNYGAAVTQLVTTPGYLEQLLRSLRQMIDAPPVSAGSF